MIAGQDAAYELAVERARADPALRSVVETSFLQEDVHEALEAFRVSESWFRARRLLRDAGAAPGARVLDFGGGRGLLAASLALDGYRVVLCEANPSRVCGAGAAHDVRSEASADFQITTRPVGELPERFDAVVCRAVLHHVRPLVPVLRDVLAVLKPGGALIAMDEPTVRRPGDVSRLRVEHPFARLGVDEIAYPVHDYLDSIQAAGFADARVLFPVAFGDYRRTLCPRRPAPIAALTYARYRLRSALFPAPGEVRAFVARRPEHTRGGSPSDVQSPDGERASAGVNEDDLSAAAASRRVAGGFSWLTLGYLSRSLVYLAITSVLVRALGPSGYGQLALFIALGTGVAYLAGSWPFMAVPVLAASGHSVGAAFRPALALAAMTALGSAAVFLPLGWSLLGGEPPAVLLVAGYGAALIGLQGLYSVFQTSERMKAIAAVQTLERVVALAALGILAAASTLSVRSAQVALAVSAAALCAAGFWGAGRQTPLLKRDRALGVRSVISAVGLMAVVTVCAYVVGWIDIVLLGALASDHAVGIYSLAYMLYTFVIQIGALWIVAALPSHARAAASGVERLESLLPRERLLGAVLTWSAGVSLVAAATAALLPVVFGSDFRDSAGPLMVLLSSAMLIAAYFAAVPVFVALRRVTSLALVSVVGAVLNLVLDLVLIPPLGIWAPALATAAQTAVVTVALLWLALGPRTALALVAASLPAAGAVALLAAGPQEWFLLALAVTVAVATGVVGTRSLGVWRHLRAVRAER